MNKRYAKIINKGECFSTLDYVNGINWKEPSMQNIACKSEWEKHNFYPSNGLVGEIVDSFYSEFMGVQVYVLKINDKFFVPMSEKGISFIQ